MTEIEYIRATNRVKVTMALTILRDVLSGEEYGITDKELAKIVLQLSSAQNKLFASYDLK